MEPDPSTGDLQSRVLQGTLDEISARQEQDSAGCCVICLESVSDGCETLPCHHHNFDYLCLLSWLEQSQKCPLCKADITQVRHALDEPVAKVYDVPPPSTSPVPAQDTRRYSTSLRLYPRFPRRRNYRNQPRSAPQNESPSGVVAWRRDIYRSNRYSKHVGSNRVSQYRELTPNLFCADTELVSRARMWIRRELQVFSFLTLDDADSVVSRPADTHASSAMAQRRANNAEFLLEYIIAVLKSVDIMGSGGQAEDMISDFLGRENTRLFLHELRAWLRSPYTKLEDWDRSVQYDEPTAEGSRAELPRTSNRDRGESVGSQHSHSTRGDYYRPSRGRVEKRRISSKRSSQGRRSRQDTHHRSDDRR
ncbi:hypothetical protein BGZ63DRAFT_416186 [Mariannaea sp. PMI_226]|nr:hypothetical protein BGZ63DRAFT_416186 [Mariannaea sp. PMI_226]